MAQVSSRPPMRDQCGCPLEQEKDALCCFLRRIHDPVVQAHLDVAAAEAASACDGRPRITGGITPICVYAARNPMRVDTVMNDR